MNAFFISLPRGWVFECAGLYQIRSYADGLTIFEFKAGLDLFKMEHNPKTYIQLLLFNINVLELSLYKSGGSHGN